MKAEIKTHGEIVVCEIDDIKSNEKKDVSKIIESEISDSMLNFTDIKYLDTSVKIISQIPRIDMSDDLDDVNQKEFAESEIFITLGEIKNKINKDM